MAKYELPMKAQRTNCSCKHCIHYQVAHHQNYDFECDMEWYMDADEESANYCDDYESFIKSKKERI